MYVCLYRRKRPSRRVDISGRDVSSPAISPMIAYSIARERYSTRDPTPRAETDSRFPKDTLAAPFRRPVRFQVRIHSRQFYSSSENESSESLTAANRRGRCTLWISSSSSSSSSRAKRRIDVGDLRKSGK